MLSFELSAIDIILTMSVVVLFILFITKKSAGIHEEKTFRQPKANTAPQESLPVVPQKDFRECPRGFGNIRTLGEDNSVSEKCLGCYRLMDCYSESE